MTTKLTSTFSKLTRFRKSTYLTKYVEFAFERAEENDSSSVDMMKYSLLNHINDETVNMFSDTFCRKLLKTHVLQSQKKVVYPTRIYMPRMETTT